MKWVKKSKWSRAGETRIKRRCLLFPKTLNGVTKWFEMASWEQKYTVHSGCWEDGDDISWDDIKWVEKESV